MFTNLRISSEKIPLKPNEEVIPKWTETPGIYVQVKSLNGGGSSSNVIPNDGLVRVISGGPRRWFMQLKTTVAQFNNTEILEIVFVTVGLDLKSKTTINDNDQEIITTVGKIVKKITKYIKKLHKNEIISNMRFISSVPEKKRYFVDVDEMVNISKLNNIENGESSSKKRSNSAKNDVKRRRTYTESIFF